MWASKSDDLNMPIRTGQEQSDETSSLIRTGQSNMCCKSRPSESCVIPIRTGMANSYGCNTPSDLARDVFFTNRGAASLPFPQGGGTVCRPN